VSAGGQAVIVRAAGPADADAIEVLTLVAYFGAEPGGHDAHAAIGSLRADDALAMSLVAEHEGYVVGHLAVSPLELSDGSTGWLLLGPLAVGPGHRGQGIATALVQAALAELDARSAAGCAVFVDSPLFRRLGFAPEPGLSRGDGGVLLARPFGERLPPLAEVRPHPALLPG